MKELAIEQYGSVASLAEVFDVARSPSSSALSGARTCSIAYWRSVGEALGVDREELDDYLLAYTRRTAGGGTLAGSIRART